MGGGELQDEEVSPYIFDASRVKEGEWPGRWEQKGRRFTWSFPDQHMRPRGHRQRARAASGYADGDRGGTRDKEPDRVRGTEDAPTDRGGAGHPQGQPLHRSSRWGWQSLKVPAGISPDRRIGDVSSPSTQCAIRPTFRPRPAGDQVFGTSSRFKGSPDRRPGTNDSHSPHKNLCVPDASA